MNREKENTHEDSRKVNMGGAEILQKKPEKEKRSPFENFIIFRFLYSSFLRFQILKTEISKPFSKYIFIFFRAYIGILTKI